MKIRHVKAVFHGIIFSFQSTAFGISQFSGRLECHQKQDKGRAFSPTVDIVTYCPWSFLFIA
jgi:hypothetical protein